ncbi:MAG: hypothetical protein HY078_07795 [Elusimicrobia bacterium]|nr:hypothetical protein [Elusimicrobiota bacterium]
MLSRLVKPRIRTAASAALAALCLSGPRSAAGSIDDSNRRLTEIACPRYDPALTHRRRPNCEGWLVRGAERIRMSYNSRGLRDKEYSRDPSTGTVRILFTGGSLISASGLEETQSPPRVLERTLRTRGLRAEVINAAVEGYSGWQNAVVLREYLDAYAPHAVIFHLAPHYAFEDRASRIALSTDGSRIVGPRTPLWLLLGRTSLPFRHHRVAAFLEREFHYWTQLNRIFASWRLAAIREDGRRLDDLLEPTIASLRQMAAFCRDRKVELYVAYGGEDVSSDKHLDFNEPEWFVRASERFWVRPFRFEGSLVEERLRAAGAREGFKVLSFGAARTGLSGAENRLPGDYHWSARGAETMARELAEQFQDAWSPR